MLAERHTAETPLPLAGSIGYLRGTAQRCRVLLHDPREKTCMVSLHHRPRGWGAWEPVPGASGCAQVPVGDLYATERLAMFCGKPPRGRR